MSSGVVPYFLNGPGPGRWTAGADALGLSGSVSGGPLRAVLSGRDPVSGAHLAAPHSPRRRAGWDLIFAAPKSVSLLAAERAATGEVAGAHRAAVDHLTEHLAGRITLRRGGRPDSLVGAAFEHHENVAGEPHLHTHLLIANLGRADGRWGAIEGPWFIGREALAALYQLELRQQLADRGWALAWRLRPDGLADLADIPRSTVRSASRQGRLVSEVGRFHARRQPADPDIRPGVGPLSWSPAAGPELADPSVARAVTTRLTTARSDFRSEDVVVALAATHPGGASVDQATAWVDRYCAASAVPLRPSSTAGPRWATPAARAADDRLAAALRLRAGRGQDDPIQRMTGRGGVHFLAAAPGTTPLLAQAEVIAACRTAWEAEGREVAVASPHPDGAMRWQVLTGLKERRGSKHPDVLIVDSADRWRTTELDRLVGSIETLVFVEGGTRPRLSNPASHGLFATVSEAGRFWCPEVEPWTPAMAGPDAPALAFGREAAERLLGQWQNATGPDRPLLVGLGVEEVRGLNRAVVGDRARVEGADRFASGDRVMMLKGRAGLANYGHFGTVLDVSSRGMVDFQWDDGSRTGTADRRALAAVGFGYAVGARRAEQLTGPLMVLGPAAAVGPARDRVVGQVALDRAVGRPLVVGSERSI
ncbi:MAG TPA: MobF family relaxase [Acidimicrobiales bacterium]|nr:MobF family relaxase [Acidimicrobiales bacterium]